jgi:cation:H+ antiporter
MLPDVLLLLGGLVLIIKGGDWFVTAAVRIAEFLRMPRVVIGSTLVSLATTTPELVVSIVAGLRGESGLAVGNAVGSVICNIGLILGTTALLKSVEIHRRALLPALLTMGALGLALLLMTLDLQLSRLQGGLLVAAGLAYFITDFWRNLRDRKPADVSEAAAIKAELTAHRPFLETRAGAFTQFLVGAAVVVVGSRLLVDGAVAVAARLAIPAIIIGLTIVAIGTSLPELVTAITSARKNVSDLSVGNVLGANIANLSLIIGTAALIREVPLDRSTQLTNFPFMVAVMGLLAVLLWTRSSLSRREGWVLIAVYVGYLITITTLALLPAGR